MCFLRYVVKSNIKNMTEKMKKVNNPLTIIAIFAMLAEVNATIVVGLIDKDLHSIFIWFIIGFPVLLVILFFITLNFNTKVMYSPSDFKDDKNLWTHCLEATMVIERKIEMILMLQNYHLK